MLDHRNATPSPAPLYLFAPLPIGVESHLAACNDLDASRFGDAMVAPHRRHITIAALGGIDAPEEHLIALIDWIMSTIPPYAFRVAFDQLILSPRRALLKGSRPQTGVLDCQAHLVTMLGDYGISLPKAATPVPHITLGYGYETLGDVRAIDGVSWQVEELVLVRSLHGHTIHQHLARWRLPARQKAAA